MWPDNETGIDLLGFEFLVDELEVLLTDERLLPMTVGVFGDWGSGKSSLMQMGQTRLETGENEGKFICVSFSPWRFEDFGYGKVALMAAVVDAIAEYAEADEGKFDRAAELANGLREKLGSWGVLKLAAKLGASAAGAGPEEQALAEAAADVVGSGGPREIPKRSFETVAHFHHEFEALIESLGEEVQAVVVFVDDMDRCSTETIVETFEAMRLFLHAPKTAYVVGAHPEIVEAALEGLYPLRQEGDESLGRNYLEKMIQNTVAVPPLSEPEAQTYINLLFAELRTDDQQFSELREAASENRARNQLSVAMNEGIAQEKIGELSPELTAELAIAAQVGPPLGRGLRGNPRQIKRFLNRFLLRLRAADRRQIQLDPAVLAKLMLLEELYPKDFERLFVWHLETDAGAPVQLKIAEEIAAGKKPKKPPTEVEDWLAQPGINGWLELSPALSGIALGPYFTFSRDRLAGTLSTARLPTELQRLLGELQSITRPKREKAIEQAAGLEAAELSELLPPLVDAARADVTSPAAHGLLGLAARRSEVAVALFDMLETLPVAKLKGNFVLSIATGFKGDARAVALLSRWAETGSKDVKRQANRGLEQK
jgi:KAP family P-loop domain